MRNVEISFSTKTVFFFGENPENPLTRKPVFKKRKWFSSLRSEKSCDVIQFRHKKCFFRENSQKFAVGLNVHLFPFVLLDGKTLKPIRLNFIWFSVALKLRKCLNVQFSGNLYSYGEPSHFIHNRILTIL